MKPIALLGVLAALSLPAGSRAAPPAGDIAGRWRFETSSFQGCVITGAMTIPGPSAAARRTCTFIAETVCKLGGAETDYWRVQETCTTSQAGDIVTIASKIDKILAHRSQDDGDGDYVADNFALTPAPDFATMTGAQIDTARRLGVKFWRDAGPIS